MSYSLLIKLIGLVEEFDQEFHGDKHCQLDSFANWLNKRLKIHSLENKPEPNWEGKESGRSPESVINTSIIHLNRYAKIYGKIALNNSPFSTLDDVIFLIVLKNKGSMTKTKLIETNVHEKSTGLQIINRLQERGFIEEKTNSADRRSKMINISALGDQKLAEVMDPIRIASKLVVGDLRQEEQYQLIIILQKLEAFHAERIKSLPDSLQQLNHR